jgi:hypothetical protein
MLIAHHMVVIASPMNSCMLAVEGVSVKKGG